MLKNWLVWTLGLALMLPLWSSPAQARGLVVKMGTMAPKGSVFHKALLQMADVFEQETGGKVKLKIYPGVVGDEPTIVRKMRVGQLQAATLTSTGLALITREPMALQLPMQFRNSAELDVTIAGMSPTFDKALEDHGFVSLTWSDGGWMYFFTKDPAVSVQDVQNRKLWMWANDPVAVEAFAVIGFAPVVLSGVDIIPSLQTGMINALPTTPVTALAMQSYPLVPNMIDVKWGVMLGGTIIDKKVWEKIPQDQRTRIRSRCQQIGLDLAKETRRQSREALEIMQKKGLVVHKPNPAQMQGWEKKAQESFAIVREKAVDSALVDQACKIRDAYRAAHPEAK